MTEHHPNCEDATGAYPGSCTCKTIAMDNLIAQDADLIDSPLVEALVEAYNNDSDEFDAANVRAAIEKRGGKIVWGEG